MRRGFASPMHVTREGPDVLSRYCPVQAYGCGWAVIVSAKLGGPPMKDSLQEVARIVGGVDTHKDLHVAAVVDEGDQVLGTHCFASTRQGYRQMVSWMRSFGDLTRVGVESTGSYGAGLLRHLQAAGVEVLEVTAPDKQDRRRRGKDMTTSTPRTRLMLRLPASESSPPRRATG